MNQISVKNWLPLCLFLMPLIVHAQCTPIPEGIAKGAVGSLASPPSGTLPKLDEVLSRTDLVVVGTVGEPHSYMSDNQCNVYTDFAISDPNVVYSRFPLSATEGSKPSLTFTQLGGTITVNGVAFTEKQTALAPLKPGQRVLLLLQRKDNKLMIADMFLGAFAVEDNNITPLMSRDDYAPEYRHVPLSEATEGISQILRDQDAKHAAIPQQQN
jgi:hypothetical protein